MFKIFYGDSVLFFAGEVPSELPGNCILPAGESFANIVEKLEKYKNICVVGTDPVAERQRFMSNFRMVDAAGGVVTNAADKLLMIYRNGRWDLPKGHREPGETTRTCAARETEEETGVLVTGHEVAPAVANTWHFYSLKDVWTMKRTYWYSLKACAGGRITPQAEEGITTVEWVTRGEIEPKADTCYPSVKEVLAASGWLDGKLY